MPRAPSRYYLYCQSVGWGMLLMIYIASGLLILHQETIKSLENAFITALTGLFMTHLLRLAILKYGWLNGPVRQGLTWVLLGAVSAAMAAGLIKVTVITLCGMTMKTVEGQPWHLRILASGIEYTLPFLPWTIIYCLYHHIQRTRQKNAEMRRLEFLLKEKSATAGDAAVDIESITRSLDRIRSLIAEDAAAARAEITVFSQLLRKGYLKINDPQ